MLMPFGKHAGTPIRELPKGYLRWLTENVNLRNPLKEHVWAALRGQVPDPMDHYKNDPDGLIPPATRGELEEKLRRYYPG